MSGSYHHIPRGMPPASSAAGSAPQSEVVITEALQTRAARASNHELEARSLRALATDLLLPPEQFLNRLPMLACQMTGAPSAGVSVIAHDAKLGKHVSWAAVAGLYAPYAGVSAPLDDSTCGHTVSCDSPQLFHRPHRRYEYLSAVQPELVECLAVPIKTARGVPLATIWVAGHDAATGFDAEDARMLTSLASAAGAALELIHSREEALERAARLARAAADAEAASDAKSNFIAALAHEMRNPLMPILSSVQVLELVAKDADLEKPIGIIKRQARQLHRLVEDLLDTARIERNEILIRKQRTELARVIADAVESVCPHVDNRQQKLKISLPPTSVSITVDHARLCEAIANIIENASKYTPDFGRIDLTAAVENDTLSIVVSDTGIGIPSEMLRRIFDLYSRADGASEHNSTGNGIGLWIVRRIVELHGGSVVADSDGAGRGSRFTITLPGVLAQ